MLRDNTINFGQGLASEPTFVVPPGAANGAQVMQVVAGADGGIELHAPAVHSSKEDDDGDSLSNDRFNENLAERINDEALHKIAGDILEGVDGDLQSRGKFLGTIASGLELLGLEIEDPGDGRDGKGISKVRHPVLAEAVVKAQSQAFPELYPPEGPCKTRVRGQTTAQLDELANALEADMNWYLTTGAREYYPDSDRGLFGLFFSGNTFKKVYRHPLRRRPVSETVSVDDLIVSQDATDLDTAIRVTHQSEYTKSAVKRMQWRGGWKDVDLGVPQMPSGKVSDKESEIIGLKPASLRPQDIPFTIYETVTDLDLSEHGINHKGQPDGLPLPVIVTVDKSSQTILAIRRGWTKGDKEFTRRQRYVHYGMIPGFGFLCFGFVHLLGNDAKVLTGIWRMLTDAGMFSNFPGGIKSKSVRMATNEISPAPGEFADVDIGPFDDIRKAIMPMPYKDLSAGLMQFAEIVGQDAQRRAGAIEMPTGEGSANVPVGTMLANVEQATQVMAAVHKRLHAAQARELELLKECFAEDPESLWRLNPDPAREWETAKEFESLNLIPASDPNVPAQIHRIMIAQALVTMAAQNPDIYDRVATHERAWKMIGVGDTASFLRQPPPQQQDPSAGLQAQAQQMQAQAKIAELQQKQQENQRKAASEALDAQQRDREMAMEGQQHATEMASKERIAAAQQQTERIRLAVEEERARRQEQTEAVQTHLDMMDRAAGRQHEAGLAQQGQQHEAGLAQQTAQQKAADAAAKETDHENA